MSKDDLKQASALDQIKSIPRCFDGYQERRYPWECECPKFSSSNLEGEKAHEMIFGVAPPTEMTPPEMYCINKAAYVLARTDAFHPIPKVTKEEYDVLSLANKKLQQSSKNMAAARSRKLFSQENIDHWDYQPWF